MSMTLVLTRLLLFCLNARMQVLERAEEERRSKRRISHDDDDSDVSV